MLEASQGYGWETALSERLGEKVYLVGGRSPGFSCFMEYLPNEDTAIIALTNIENAANPMIVQNAAALLLGKPYQAFSYHKVPPALVGHLAGDFVFGSAKERHDTPHAYRNIARMPLTSCSKFFSAFCNSFCPAAVIR